MTNPYLSVTAPCDITALRRLTQERGLPWLTFSAISLPTPTPADSNPRITFGKFTQEGDRVLLPVNLTANHALVDGLHLAAFFDGMAQRAAHPEEYF